MNPDPRRSGPPVRVDCSPGFREWLAASGASIAFSTYQTGKLFLVGSFPDGRLSIFERTFDRCMGLAVSGNSLWAAAKYQLWRLENTLAAGELHGYHDKLYIPRVAYVTGDLDAHDVAVQTDGRPIFANTLFSCLAYPSETHSFSPAWTPRFIEKLEPVDACHLNGVAVRDGYPAFVTCAAMTSAPEGWREKRRTGGTVIDTATQEAVATGLSMPHSPRWHRNQLWILDSGNGYLGYVDLKACAFRPIAFCPGYLRGLALNGNTAVLGMSLPRRSNTFSGLGLDEQLSRYGASPQCGIVVVDLDKGSIVHRMYLEGLVEELYDVVLLRETRCPAAIGLKSDEVERTISIAPAHSV